MRERGKRLARPPQRLILPRVTSGVGGLHHLALKVREPERVAAFYRDVLGLEEVTRHVDTVGLRSIWLRLGGALLMVERSATGGAVVDFDSDPPGLHLFAVSIDPEDREKWERRLEAHGYPVHRRSAFTLYVADPEGHRVALSHHPHPAPNAGATD